MTQNENLPPGTLPPGTLPPGTLLADLEPVDPDAVLESEPATCVVIWIYAERKRTSA